MRFAQVKHCVDCIVSHYESITRENDREHAAPFGLLGAHRNTYIPRAQLRLGLPPSGQSMGRNPAGVGGGAHRGPRPPSVVQSDTHLQWGTPRGLLRIRHFEEGGQGGGGQNDGPQRALLSAILHVGAPSRSPPPHHIPLVNPAIMLS